MSNKVRLISTISAICMVLALLTVGVWAVSSASVTLGGSVSFTADNVHARITGNVTGTQETISLPNLEYDVNTDVNATAFQEKLSSWANNDMTFTSENLITMTITVENLSEERSLFVTLTDNTTTTNVGKTLKQGASDYTSATAVEVSAKGTTTFTMTLSVTDKNQSASATVSYQVDLRDANAEEPILKLDENKSAKGLTYEIGDGSVTTAITSYDNSYSGDVVIPAQVEYNDAVYDVTAIYKSSFEDCVNITSISIPESVTYIDDYAFKGCTGLITVNLPKNLEYLGYDSFVGCSNLQNIVIPSGLTQINDGTFGGCKSLTEINIPDNITSIGMYAFEGCTGLTIIKIPSSVQTMDGAAFENSGLKTVVIDSEKVAAAQKDYTGFVAWVPTIYVKTEIVNAGKVGSGLTNTKDYPNVETITSGEYAGYTKYSY